MLINAVSCLSVTRSNFLKGIVALVCLLTVLAIGLPILLGCGHNAYEAKAKSDVFVVGKVIDLYKSDHGQYPTDLSQLAGDYVRNVPTDPWGKDYQYIRNGNIAIIFTYGDPESEGIIYHVEGKKI